MKDLIHLYKLFVTMEISIDNKIAFLGRKPTHLHSSKYLDIDQK